jgi:hypothetical protein
VSLAKLDDFRVLTLGVNIAASVCRRSLDRNGSPTRRVTPGARYAF